MPTATQFLEHFQIFPVQTTLNDHPEILNALVDYVSILPNPLLSNEQQCYVYPNKSTQILSIGTAYRSLVAKKQRKSKKTNESQSYYPFLERLMKNIMDPVNQQQTLLGYVNRILVSLTKKTPQIYQFFKDNEGYISSLINRNQLLSNFLEFFTIFITQSTMTLYVFLKNIFLRTLMYRLIDENDKENLSVYEALDVIYSQICLKLKAHIVPEDERDELIEISQSFHEENFVTLMVLKISLNSGEKTFRTAKYLNNLLNYEPEDLSSLVTDTHLDTLQEYFELYEESSFFMEIIRKEELQMLKVFMKLSQSGKLTIEQEANLLKRLLVYGSVHKQNSLLHCMVFDALNYVIDGSRLQVFNYINVIPFFMKNSQEKDKKYGWQSLIWRVCHFWKKHEKQLFRFLQSEDEKTFIFGIISEGKAKRKGLTLYEDKDNILENEDQCKTNQLEYSSDGSAKVSPQKQPQNTKENIKEVE